MLLSWLSPQPLFSECVFKASSKRSKESDQSLWLTVRVRNRWNKKVGRGFVSLKPRVANISQKTAFDRAPELL